MVSGFARPLAQYFIILLWIPSGPAALLAFKHRPSLSKTDPLYQTQTHFFQHRPTLSKTDPVSQKHAQFIEQRPIFNTDPLHQIQVHFMKKDSLSNTGPFFLRQIHLIKHSPTLLKTYLLYLTQTHFFKHRCTSSNTDPVCQQILFHDKYCNEFLVNIVVTL